MTILRSSVTVAGGVLLGAAAGLLALPIANAEPTALSGTYEETDDTGTYTWNFSPCGSACTRVSSSDDSSVDNMEFRLKGGRWSGSGPFQVHCRSGGGAATISYSFDATSLDGDYVVTLTEDACGDTAGTSGDPNHFQLTKVD